MKTFLAVILILTALLLACTSEPSSSQQAGNAAGGGNCSASHATTHLTTSPADGYGNDQHCHNGVARHGVSHPF